MVLTATQSHVDVHAQLALPPRVYPALTRELGLPLHDCCMQRLPTRPTPTSPLSVTYWSS